jgi:hypothetical protein
LLGKTEAVLMHAAVRENRIAFSSIPNRWLISQRDTSCRPPNFGEGQMHEAIAPPRKPETTRSVPDRQATLKALADVAPSEADFLSCYLDLEDDETACNAFVRRRVEELRAGFDGTVRLDFEQALEMLQSALDSVWTDEHNRPAAVAVFARGLNEHCHLVVVPMHEAVEPAMTWYRLPDLTQLWANHQPDRDFTLVLARRGGIQVIDVQGESTTPRAWASYRIGRGASDARPSATNLMIPPQRLKVLRRSLAGPSELPLVIAGDGHCLDELTGAMPARALTRLRDVMRLPSHLDTDAAVAFAKRRIDMRLNLQNERAAARLMRVVEKGGLAVTGAAASHSALRAGAAEMLIIAKPHCAETLLQCSDCGAISTSTHVHGTCAACGGKAFQEWDAAVELVRLALQQGVPVVRTDSEDIEVLGGFGCLLRQPVESEVIAEPTAQPGTTLDLVA